MHLAEYLKKKSLSQACFGALMDPPVSQGLVGQWLTGRTRITLRTALQIDVLTNGDVTPQDCADMFSEHEKALAKS